MSSAIYDAPALAQLVDDAGGANVGPFEVKGGLYLATVVATWNAGSVKLQKLAPDGSTYLSLGSDTDFAANGVTTVYLNPGQYRWTIASATGVSAELSRVPIA